MRDRKGGTKAVCCCSFILVRKDATSSCLAKKQSKKIGSLNTNKRMKKSADWERPSTDLQCSPWGVGLSLSIVASVTNRHDVIQVQYISVVPQDGSKIHP